MNNLIKIVGLFVAFFFVFSSSADKKIVDLDSSGVFFYDTLTITKDIDMKAANSYDDLDSDLFYKSGSCVIQGETDKIIERGEYRTTGVRGKYNNSEGWTVIIDFNEKSLWFPSWEGTWSKHIVCLLPNSANKSREDLMISDITRASNGLITF